MLALSGNNFTPFGDHFVCVREWRVETGEYKKKKKEKRKKNTHTHITLSQFLDSR